MISYSFKKSPEAIVKRIIQGLPSHPADFKVSLEPSKFIYAEGSSQNPRFTETTDAFREILKDEFERFEDSHVTGLAYTIPSARASVFELGQLYQSETGVALVRGNLGNSLDQFSGAILEDEVLTLYLCNEGVPRSCSIDFSSRMFPFIVKHNILKQNCVSNMPLYFGQIILGKNVDTFPEQAYLRTGPFPNYIK